MAIIFVTSSACIHHAQIMWCTSLYPSISLFFFLLLLLFRCCCRYYYLLAISITVCNVSLLLFCTLQYFYFDWCSLILVCCFCHVSGRQVVDHQRLSAGGYCYSAAAPPFTSAAASAALRMLRAEPGLVASLRTNAEFLHKAVATIPGLKVGDDTLYVVLIG